MPTIHEYEARRIKRTMGYSAVADFITLPWRQLTHDMIGFVKTVRKNYNEFGAMSLPWSALGAFVLVGSELFMPAFALTVGVIKGCHPVTTGVMTGIATYLNAMAVHVSREDDFDGFPRFHRRLEAYDERTIAVVRDKAVTIPVNIIKDVNQANASTPRKPDPNKVIQLSERRKKPSPHPGGNAA